MPIVTLLEKLYADIPLKPVESHIQALCDGLKVTVKVIGITDRGWMRVNVSGEDEVAALSLIEKEFGTAPIYAKNVQGNAYRGKIVFSGKSDTEVYVDIGVSLPTPVDAIISLQHLQAQLVDGRKMQLKRIRGLFCFQDNFPLEILIKRLDDKRKCLLAELSERQIALILQWVNSSLDRLVVFGALSGDIENAVKKSGHLRDVAEIERLGMLEHTVVCKLGTDARGLIPRIGRLLPHAVFGVFSPKEISRFVTI